MELWCDNVLILSPRIRVRERLSRDENVQRPPDWSPDRHQVNRHQVNRHRTQSYPAGYKPQHSESSPQRTVHHPSSPPEYQHYGHALDSQPYLSVPAPPSPPKHGPPEAAPRRKVNADQIYASHKEARLEARLEARQALKEEAHTEGLLKSRKAVLPSEIRRREKSVDDTHRGRHEDMDWQNYSPEQRRVSQGEEDWDWDKPRERGRERAAERVRERGREDVSNHNDQEERERPVHQSSQHQTQPLETQTAQHHAEPRRRQHVQILEQDLPTQHQYDHWSSRPEEPERQEPPAQQQDVQGRHQLSKQDEGSEGKREQHGLSSGHQRSESAIYLQKGSGRTTETSAALKPKVRTRSMSDIGVSQHTAMYRMDRAAAVRDTSRAVPPTGVVNGEMGTLDTRVSVAQLRHSYLENANRKPEL